MKKFLCIKEVPGFPRVYQWEIQDFDTKAEAESIAIVLVSNGFKTYVCKQVTDVQPGAPSLTPIN